MLSMTNNKTRGRTGGAGVHGGAAHGAIKRPSITGEEDAVPEESSIEAVIQRCLFVVSLLSQFSNSQVRADFQGGKFELPSDHEVSLLELDLLFSALCPPWKEGGSIKKRTNMAQVKLFKLINREKGELSIDGLCENSKTFCKWSDILFCLADNEYWENAPSTNEEMLHNADTNQTTKCIGRSTSTVGTSTEPKEYLHVGTNTQETDILVCNGKVPVNIVNSKCEHFVTDQESLPTTTSLFDSVKVGILDINGSQTESTLLQLTDGADNTRCTLVSKISNSVLQQGCQWCGKGNHSLENCWRRQGLCLICGGSHKLIYCSLYSESNRIQHKPKCSVCGGDHFGKDCRRAKKCKIDKICNWCGKVGHEEDSCRRKSHSCYICGSADHMLNVCPQFKPQSLCNAVFPPWCNQCGGNHLGKNCDSPYME